MYFVGGHGGSVLGAAVLGEARSKEPSGASPDLNPSWVLFHKL